MGLAQKSRIDEGITRGRRPLASTPEGVRERACVLEVPHTLSVCSKRVAL